MRCTTIQKKPTGTRGYNGRNNMSTFKVTLHWDFIVEATSHDQSKLVVAELTDPLFQKMTRLDEFAYESITAEMIDSQGAGVDARL